MKPAPARIRATGAARAVVESLVCLTLAVILFRTFEMEGYMISTGSMAPHLLGFHKRVTCPACGWHFACGVQYDESVVASMTDVNDGPAPSFDPLRTACPNCGQSSIDLSQVPKNQGDQLLVAKCAYEFRPPRRWDVAVFRNPFKPTQAYVKRVVGLPGEAVQIVHGDLYADGRIQRKDLATQRAMRIPVFNASFEPPEKAVEWEPRWVITEPVTHWLCDGPAFEYDDSDGKPSDAMEWLTYRHWIRQGGTQTTTVLLPAHVPEPVLSSSPFVLLRYDPKARTLSCSGAMPIEWRDEVLEKNSDEQIREAVAQLYEESHVAAVTDDYGYNRLAPGMTPLPVRDLMISAKVVLQGTSGRFALEMSDGPETFTLEWNLADKVLRLLKRGESRPLRETSLSEEMIGRAFLVEMSLFDRQVLVSLDGQLAFPTWEMPEEAADSAEPGPPARRPVRFGATNVHARLEEVVLYRDVHYTRGKARNGVGQPFPLDPDSYFMLGDNSPVSADSRNWPDGAVHRNLLLGKPFVVHLPSRPGQLKVGHREFHVRIPDFSRVRYIR